MLLGTTGFYFWYQAFLGLSLQVFFVLPFQFVCLFVGGFTALFCPRRVPDYVMKPEAVLVTGGGSGIGKEMAVLWAREKVPVVVITDKNAEAMEQTRIEAEVFGAKVITAVIDVTDEAGMKKFIEETDAKHPLDVVVANAGISEQLIGKSLDVEGATRAVLAVNVMGVINTVLPALALMRKRDRGQIAIVASAASFVNLWTNSHTYCASKAFVRFWGMSLRAYLWNTGVRVNVICPGWVNTNLVRDSLKNIKSDATIAKHIAVGTAEKLLKFMCTPVEVAQVFVARLASDQGLITYPTYMFAILQLIANTPSVLYDFLLRTNVFPDWKTLPREVAMKGQ